MKRWIIGAAILAAAFFPVKWAYAQLGVVLTSCGTLNYDQTQSRPQTIDIAGRMCVLAGIVGSPNIATGQVSVGTTATLIVPARAGRRALTIIHEGTADIRYGASGVTTGTGALLAGTKGTSMTAPVTGPLYGIVGTGTQPLSYVETW